MEQCDRQRLRKACCDGCKMGGCWMLWVGLVLWIILGSVMLAVRDTIDGQLQFAGKTTGRDIKGNVITNTHVDFIQETYGNRTVVRCRFVVDSKSLPDGDWDIIEGAYETVTKDCWVNKPSIQLMAIIGASISATTFLIPFFSVCIDSYHEPHYPGNPYHPPPQRTRRPPAQSPSTVAPHVFSLVQLPMPTITVVESHEPPPPILPSAPPASPSASLAAPSPPPAPSPSPPKHGPAPPKKIMSPKNQQNM
jgi:hypothetical protein